MKKIVCYTLKKGAFRTNPAYLLWVFSRVEEGDFCEIIQIRHRFAWLLILVFCSKQRFIRKKCVTTIPCIKKGRSFDPHLSRLHIYNGVTNGINPSVATVLHQFFHAIAVTAYSKRSNQRRLKLYHYTI